MISNGLLRCLIALLCSLAWQAGLAEPPDAGDSQRFALVIGISDYPGNSLDLPLVSEDVKAVKAMLTADLGFEQDKLLVLENEQATRRAILEGINGFLGQAGTDDIAVIYYSGHGTRTQDNVAASGEFDPEADGRDEALVAYDQLLVDDEIAFALNSIAAGRLLVLIDSCHSGDATRADTERGMPKKAEWQELSKYISLPEDFIISAEAAEGDWESALSEIDAQRDGRLFIAASDENELSWVAPNLGLSLFTFHLTRRLPQAGDKSFQEFVDEVSPRVNRYAQQHFQAAQSTHLEAGEASARMTIDEFFD